MIFSNRIFAILLCSVVLTVSAAHAQVTQTVLVRGHNFKPTLIETQMPDLISDTSFDGRYFKMVLAKSNTAIPLSEPNEVLRLKAATAYYHLNKARDFWVNDLHSEFAEKLPKMTVRLELTNVYSDLGHWERDSNNPQYNNALSIPEWTQMEGIEIPEADRWGKEIWFRPMVKVRTEDLPNSGMGPSGNPLSQYLSMISEPVTHSATNRIIQNVLESIFYPENLNTDLKTSILRQAGTVALTLLILEGAKHTDKLFLEKYYYLDTAMIPEIVYHEYGHHALSDRLAISHSTPVNEGMADYFATAIGNNPSIAKKMKKYSLAMPKNGKNKNRYDPIYETSIFANSDFVLSVLWSIKKEFPEVADQLIYDARTHLSTGESNIRSGLLGALIESCKTVCLTPRVDRLKMLEIFELRGFSP